MDVADFKKSSMHVADFKKSSMQVADGWFSKKWRLFIFRE
jgi:hypothetical protein